MHPIFTIPLNTLKNNPTPKWFQYLHQHENQYTSIICIHNQSTRLGNQQLIQNKITNILELYNTCENQPTQPTPIDYRVKFTKLWWATPKTTPSTLHSNKTPFPDNFYHINTPNYNPQQCIYKNRSFIPPNEHGIGNIVGLGVYILNNDLHIA